MQWIIQTCMIQPYTVEFWLTAENDKIVSVTHSTRELPDGFLAKSFSMQSVILWGYVCHCCFSSSHCHTTKLLSSTTREFTHFFSFRLLYPKCHNYVVLLKTIWPMYNYFHKSSNFVSHTQLHNSIIKSVLISYSCWSRPTCN